MGNRGAHTDLPAEARAWVSRVQTFSSLRYRDYRLLWSGTLFTSAGNWIQQVTLGWLIYEMTGSVFLLGALQGARALPFLVFGPLAGVLCDRFDRRKLLMANQVFLALLALSFAVLVSLGWAQVWHLFAFTTLSGVGWAVNNPLRQTLVADSVPRQALANAIALNSIAFNISRVAGPAVGGLLIALFGPGTNFFIQAACYAAVALAVFPMRVERQGLAANQRDSVFANLREGLNYVAKEQTTLALIVLGMIPSLLVMPFITGLMPAFAKDTLHVGPDGLGFLLSTFGIGAILGLLGLATLGNIKRKGLVILGAGIFSGLGMVALSRATTMSLAIPFVIWIGAMHVLYNAINNTIIQTITPDALRGRVMSIYMLDVGLMPLGSLLAGSLASLDAVPLALLVGGSLTIALILLASIRFKVIRSVA
mgnify:CR=1 FL=1